MDDPTPDRQPRSFPRTDADDATPTLELPAVPVTDADDPVPTLQLPVVRPPAQHRRWRGWLIGGAVVLIGALGGGLAVAAMTTSHPNAVPSSTATRHTSAPPTAAPPSAKLHIAAWIAPNTGNRTAINLFVTIMNEHPYSVPLRGIDVAFFDQQGGELTTVDVPLAIGGGGGFDASPPPGQAIGPHASWTWWDIDVVPAGATSVKVVS